MFPEFFLALISLVFLIIIHEFGHFILAKRFGVKVEEFGIGYPPRIIGKKIGETIYSLNLLPFGAFVRMAGEIGKVEEERSFSGQPVGKRALIVLGGVVSFWIIAVILLTIVLALGVPTAISDEENANLKDPKVQIAQVSFNSPAESAGLKPGDTIRRFKVEQEIFEIQKVKEIQELTERSKGKEITLTIERGKEVFDLSLVPRVSPPAGEGPMGLALVRTAIKSFPWYEAPLRGVIATFNLTMAVIGGWIKALVLAFKGLPTGVVMMGPVGIAGLFGQASQLGLIYFFQFVAIISIFIALFNILPIPALDGGKLLFLAIEGMRKKAVSPKVEQTITAIFFAFLLTLLIWVTIKDISRLF